jgi:UDP-N-acetylmuramoylalanine--D-glutamate ligase
MTFPIKNRTVLILGLGGYAEGSGVAAALFCLKRGAKKVIVTDLRPAAELRATVRQLAGKPRVELVLGGHRLKDVRAADLVVKNPGVPEHSAYVKLAKKLKKPITNDIGLFLDAKPAGPVVAVTGTRGKTTTTTLIYEMVRRQHPRTWLGGNVGRSPLLFVDKMKPGDHTVLELSSWMLHDLVKPHFDVAVVTNILPDHLNRYRDMDHYQADKERIFRWQKPWGVTVLNAANARTRGMAKRVRGATVLVSAAGTRRGLDAWVANGQLVVGGMPVGRTTDLKLLGSHNIQNALMAAAAARALAVSPAQIRRVLRSFTGVANRLELIATVAGVKYYNDTTATTPDASIAALRAFPKKVILIAGGNSKGLSLAAYARAIKQQVKELILLAGNANAPLRRAVSRAHLYEAAEMLDAVEMAAVLARRGDIVLLSPGCTWLPKMNEFERGKQFVRAVRRLKK